jgi:hypothetical protein
MLKRNRITAVASAVIAIGAAGFVLYCVMLSRKAPKSKALEWCLCLGGTRSDYPAAPDCVPGSNAADWRGDYCIAENTTCCATFILYDQCYDHLSQVGHGLAGCREKLVIASGLYRDSDGAIFGAVVIAIVLAVAAGSTYACNVAAANHAVLVARKAEADEEARYRERVRMQANRESREAAARLASTLRAQSARTAVLPATRGTPHDDAASSSSSSSSSSWIVHPPPSYPASQRGAPPSYSASQRSAALPSIIPAILTAASGGASRREIDDDGNYVQNYVQNRDNAAPANPAGTLLSAILGGVWG